MRQQMKILARARGLENAILLSVLLFLFNLVFPLHDNTILFCINEILVFLTMFFLYNYIHQFLSSKVDSPLSLILNAGILGALLFFIISITNSLFGSENGGKINFNFFNSLFSILLIFVFLGAVVYIFSTFRELFFLRQKKDPTTYFNTVLVFFTLSFFSGILLQFGSDLDYISDTFYYMTIVLICLSSIRVAWIAFLPKRQKYYLLIFSVILSILFGATAFIANRPELIKKLLYTFSPGFYTVSLQVLIYGTIYFAIIFFTTLFHLPTAEAFDRKAEEASSLMDLTKLITQVFDFKELADTVTNITTRVCNSDSAWLVTKRKNEMELSSVHKIGFVEADKISKTLLDSDKNDFDSIEIVHYDSISRLTKTGEQEFKYVAIAPLKVHGEVNGYLFAARQKDNAFDSDEKKSVQGFADYAAVALENAKLIEESIEKERLEKELDVARDVQRKILPSTIPSSDQLKISALFVPAFEVGGDYYDFFELENDRMGFVVADVAGKGISAAFIMSEVKGIFESLSKLISNPRELLIKANDVLKGSLDKRNFVTAIYGIIDKKSGKLTLARAGHTPLLVCSEGNVSRLQPPGIGLGLDYTASFTNSIKEMEIQLKNNDIVICYSDGIPEAKNSKHEDFGYERLETIIANNCSKDLDFISNSIMKEISLFSRDNTQHDDITFVIFRWNQSK